MVSRQARASQLRLFILSPTSSINSAPSPFPPVLTSLTTVSPSEDIDTYAGYTSHAPLQLRTKYYSADVNIWCDELPRNPEDTSSRRDVLDRREPPSRGSEDVALSEEVVSLSQWTDQMLSSAAAEVRAVIGGMILILPIDSSTASAQTNVEYVEAVHALREVIEEESGGRDIASIVVLQPAEPVAKQLRSPRTLHDRAETLANLCVEQDMFGWDVVSWDAAPEPSGTKDRDSEKRNEFGEKQGMARVLEVLEGIDWSANLDEVEDGLDASSEGGVDVLGTGRTHGLDAELQREMLDLKLSMVDQEDSAADDDDADGEEMTVEEMDSLRSRVLAVRDTVAGMPAAQKEAFAKREIDKIMRGL